MSSIDRFERLLADLEARVRCTCRCCDRSRALADAAAEPERPERCPACGWMGSGCDTCDEGAAAECRDPWHDGGSR